MQGRGEQETRENPWCWADSFRRHVFIQWATSREVLPLMTGGRDPPTQYYLDLGGWEGINWGGGSEPHAAARGGCCCSALLLLRLRLLAGNGGPVVFELNSPQLPQDLFTTWTILQ